MGRQDFEPVGKKCLPPLPHAAFPIIKRLLPGVRAAVGGKLVLGSIGILIGRVVIGRIFVRNKLRSPTINPRTRGRAIGQHAHRASRIAPVILGQVVFAHIHHDAINSNGIKQQVTTAVLGRPIYGKSSATLSAVASVSTCVAPDSCGRRASNASWDFCTCSTSYRMSLPSVADDAVVAFEQATSIAVRAATKTHIMPRLGCAVFTRIIASPSLSSKLYLSLIVSARPHTNLPRRDSMGYTHTQPPAISPQGEIMICNIVHSPIMLRMPSVPATPEDIAIGRDLADTLAAHSHECVGLAANMIGKRKCVIAATDGPRTLVMFNPRIIERHDEYQTEEACLSLEGTRPCRRYRNIRVTYLDDSWHEHTRSFSGFVAQIIQHECDHCEGIVI